MPADWTWTEKGNRAYIARADAFIAERAPQAARDAEDRAIRDTVRQALDDAHKEILIGARMCFYAGDGDRLAAGTIDKNMEVEAQTERDGYLAWVTIESDTGDQWLEIYARELFPDDQRKVERGQLLMVELTLGPPPGEIDLDLDIPLPEIDITLYPQGE